MRDEQSQPDEDTAFDATPPGEAGARVLVIDDDPALLLLIEETLCAVGYRVRTAAGGRAGLEACAGFSPDLVLLDINMPDMDGILVCRELRKQAGHEFPIVMVTSVDDAASIRASFEAGATDFIVKPVNWPLFQRRMESILVDWRRAVELNESRGRLSALQRVAPDEAFLVSRQGLIVEDLKERSAAATIHGRNTYPSLDDLYGAEIGRRFRQCISSVLKTTRSRSLRFRSTDGGCTDERQADIHVDSRDRVIVVVQSVEEQLKADRTAYELAFLDEATGLPNRHLFWREAPALCSDALLRGRCLVLISIHVGDGGARLLADATVAQAFASSVERAAAGTGMAHRFGDADVARCVVRLSPSEFVAILDNVSEGDALDETCAEIARSVRHADTAGIDLSLDCGVAVLPRDGRNADQLLLTARAARREASSSGADAGFFSSDTGVPDGRLLDSAAELRQAIDNDELELHYLPRVATATGRVTSIEALLRWNHPMRGFVELSELLQVAQTTGLITDIGDWVLRTACRFAQGLQQHDELRVSVNLSSQELLREDLVDQVRNALTGSGLPASRLEIEVTEAALLRVAGATSILESLNELGVAVVLDDFGTGHTSLATLKRLPLCALKIDASFVRGSTTDPDDAAICKVVVSMAHTMGLAAIAEGVETPEEREFVVSAGCDELQGYLLSRPLDQHDLVAFLSGAKALQN